MSYFSKGLSDSLVQASSTILRSEPEYSVGDSVMVNHGPNTGKDGKVVNIKSSGYSDVQLTQGRYITIANEHLGSSSNLLTEKKSLDSADKKDFFKKKFAKKTDDDDNGDDNGDEDEDEKDNEDETASGKKGKKAKGKNGEDIKIDPDLDEVQDYHRQANIMQSSRALSLIKGIIGNR